MAERDFRYIARCAHRGETATFRQFIRSVLIVQTRPHGSVFISTALVAVAEIGDKTQIATVALAARFQSPVLVTAGTTLGLMLFGDAIARRVPLEIVRIAALLFVALGIAAGAAVAMADLSPWPVGGSSRLG
jgi:putative Ca2+/H+ antiporter (TMEM165/GDT1 family)